MKSLPCEVVLDLIPLVKDGVASEISEKLVHEHIENCQQCSKEYQPGGESITQHNISKDKEIVKKIKKSLWGMQMLVLLSGAILGVSFTFTGNLFLNSLIMPAIGMLGYFIFRSRWYITPLAVAALISVSTIARGIGEGRVLEYLSALGVYGFIYLTLVLVGWLIGFLISYAIRGEVKK